MAKSQTIPTQLSQAIELLEPEGDMSEKLRQLLLSEAQRRLLRYRRQDQKFSRKYGISFAEFVARRTVAQKKYSFEVESDFWDWELAQDGLATMKKLLEQLQRPHEDGH